MLFKNCNLHLSVIEQKLGTKGNNSCKQSMHSLCLTILGCRVLPFSSLQQSTYYYYRYYRIFCILKEEVSQRRSVIWLYTHALEAFGYFYPVSWFDKTKDHSLCLRWGACLPLEQSISWCICVLGHRKPPKKAL